MTDSYKWQSEDVYKRHFSHLLNNKTLGEAGEETCSSRGTGKEQVKLRVPCYRNRKETYIQGGP